jgi:hypothetical protein
MRVINWAVLGRSAVRLAADRLLRSLLALGTMATGTIPPGWRKSRGEHWWDGAAPAEGTGVRSVLAAARVEPGSLRDPELLRRMRSLRGSEDLFDLDGTGATHADAAPSWHPERRPGGRELTGDGS